MTVFKIFKAKLMFKNCFKVKLRIICKKIKLTHV